MKILAIDTSGQTASAALIEDEKLIGEFTQNDKLTHSQTILPMVVEICEKTNTDPKDVDYIACAVGPGSFTGLRIGAATAKGLCLGLNKPLLAVPTLDALAYHMFMTGAIVCPTMDARRQQVYACFYEWQGEKLVPLTEYMAESIDVIIDKALSFQRDVIFLGDGVPVHKEKLAEKSELPLCPCSLRFAACGGSGGLRQSHGGRRQSHFRQRTGTDLSAEVPGRKGKRRTSGEGGSGTCLKSSP